MLSILLLDNPWKMRILYLTYQDTPNLAQPVQEILWSKATSPKQRYRLI
jgi:hypothetical protein